MKDEEKTREQIMQELAEAQAQVAELKRSVSKLEQSCDALRESSEQYLLHFSLTDEVMFSYDNQFKILSVSPNVEKILGYKPEDLIGRNALDLLTLLSTMDQEEAVDNALHVLAGQTIRYSIYQFITKDGKRIFGEVSGSPFLRNGKVVCAISVARDITDRINMKKSLRVSEETVKALLNASSEALLMLDTEGVVLDLNETAAQRMGKSVKELVGSSFFEHVPNDTAKRRKVYFDQLISSGKPIRFIDERQGRVYHNSLFPANDDHGRVTRIAVYTKDITESRRTFMQ